MSVRQLEGIVGKMIGESKIDPFGQLCKRTTSLDVNIDQSEMVTVSEWCILGSWRSTRPGSSNTT